MKFAIPAESRVTPCAIHRDAKEFRVEGFEFRQHFIVEGHLVAADGAPVSGIKCQHDGSPAKVAQADLLVRGALECEIGSGCACWERRGIVACRARLLLGSHLSMPLFCCLGMSFDKP